MTDLPRNPNATESQATIVFVLGLLGLVACQVIGPFAWYMGNQYMDACRAENIEPLGLGVAGRVLGIVGTAFLIIGLVIAVLYVAFICCYLGCSFGMVFLMVVAGAASGS